MSTVVVPDLLELGARGRATCAERALLRRRVRNAGPCAVSAGELAQVLEERHERALGGVFVVEVLRWPYGLFERNVPRLIRHAGIPPTARVGDLTDEQRQALVLLLRSPRLLLGARTGDG